MGQLQGQIVAVDIEYDDDTRAVIPDTGTLGIVESVADVLLNQPDVVVYETGSDGVPREVSRTEPPQMAAQQASVVWKDGSTSTLTEHIDQWVVIGSVFELPNIKGDDEPPGSFAELPEQQAKTDAAIADISNYLDDVIAAAPIKAAAADVTTEVVHDGTFTIAN